MRYAVSISLIALLLYVMRGNYNKILLILKEVDIRLFICANLLFIFDFIVVSLRLKMIFMAQKMRLTMAETVRINFVGAFFNNCLPTSIGGDVVKACYVTKKPKDGPSSFSSIFMDRFLGFLTMIFMAAVAFLFLRDAAREAAVDKMIYGVIALATVFIVFLFNKGFASKFSFLLRVVRPLEDKLKNLYTTVHDYKHHKALLAQAIVVSLLSQMLYFYYIFLLVKGIGGSIAMRELFLRMPLVSILALLPSINGLGVREGAMVLLFGSLIGRESAFATSLLVLTSLMMVSLLGGLIYAFSPQFKLTKEEAIA